MRKQINTVQSMPAFLAVLLLLIASSSHIHLRYCLDGDEAPVSIHFETNDSHPSEIDLISGIAEADQSDIESELSVSLSPILFLLHPPETLPNKPATLLPLTRAPPVLA